MKRKHSGKRFILPFAVLVVCAAAFVSCGGDDLGDDPDGPDGPDGPGNGLIRSTIKMTKEQDPGNKFDPLNRKPLRVVQTVWYEPEEDPRQVIGYELTDGTAYFDHLVFLYGLRLRDRDCNLFPSDKCKESGLHACYGPNNMNVYLTEWQTYIRPVRDSGIKVLLSLVPAGNGVGVGNLFESTSWSDDDVKNYGPYPFGGEFAKKMIDNIAKLLLECQIDGIAFDEEYIGHWSPPGSKDQRTIATNTANIIRFCYELQAAMDKLGGANREGTKHLGENGKLIFECYAYSPITDKATFTSFDGKDVTVLRNDIVNYIFNQSYGGWASPPSGFPRDRWGPVSVAIADVDGSSPRPAYRDIEQRMSDHLYGSYGVVMYYCLRSRDELKEGIPKWNKLPWTQNMFGPGNAGKPEAYFSIISNTLFGKATRYTGQDYPRRFQTQ